MIKVAVLSFSDGRERVHESLKDYIVQCNNNIIRALESTGEVDVVYNPPIIHTNAMASELAGNMVGVDACILNVCVFSFPNFSSIANSLIHLPKLAIAPINGAYPGLGGLQATVNLIRQTGGQCEKIWGNIETKDILNRVMTFLRAGYATKRLKGQVLGLFGGRSIGIGSGTANPDLWMNKFGIDIDHIDQLEIVRRAQTIDDVAADKGLDWLEMHMGDIHYDNDKLTRDSLRMQVKCYLALKELIQEKSLDFVAVKCHYDLSEYYWTQCLAAALSNDPYDWDGPKAPIVYSCEADADAALTMQVLYLISGKPTLFMDFRHYLEEDEVFAFCNCGACATWYANRSDDPAENLKDVELSPLIPKYAGKGCHVHYIAAPGLMTFARFTRVLDRYKLQAFYGDFYQLPKSKLEQTCPVWPHGYTKVNSDPYELAERFECNHIHAVAGDYIEELQLFCKLNDIDFELL